MAMIKPPTWHDPDGSAYSKWDEQYGWRTAGCTGEKPPPGEEDNLGCLSQIYTNGTYIPGSVTLADDSPMLTYPLIAAFTHKNPWRAPGTAPMYSPCGVDGGNPLGCPVGYPGKDHCAGGGYGHGPDSRTLPGNTKPAEWTAGAQEEVAFGVTANHGGGYIYRLCPKPSTGYKDLTEECFQSGGLKFVGSTQWIQYKNNERNRTAVTAVQTTKGTHPAGSQWRRNPIPACGTLGGGADTEYVQPSTCIGSMFPPPVPGLRGFNGFTPYDTKTIPWVRKALTHYSVVDKVQVPKDLKPGDYVLSFRIDCEQTSQIWSQCADIRVSASTSVHV